MNTEDSEFERIEREQAMRNVPDAIHHTDTSEPLMYIQGWNDCRQAMLEQPAQAQSLRDTLERPAYTHALALKNLRDALELVLSWIDDWCETGSETGFGLIEEKANAALAEQPAQQESVGEIGKIVLFGGQCKEVSWRDGKMPPVGTVLYTSSPNPQAAQQGVDEFDVGWNAARRFYTSPQARPAREPTKAMIDAAERIDWSDSDVRGNIVNMWQAMCAVAPQAQQEPMTAKEIREWWAAENGLEDCDMAKADDFEQVVRAIEAAHGIKEKNT